ncbi:NAD-dependent epimerase/dehydratase family protein [Pendulispora brunnea]|uniref:NAD-dependent epimerase/dehydratase family protein n=1 Tax=Pendulispora brunnea TaxID=2905690 RepID=A0ABZ2K8Q6_9BACT
MAHVLVTGGAGFIGSHLADHLTRSGHRVRALDNLDPQVHGADRARPKYLHRDVELVVGDVRDGDAVRKALDGIDVVFHLAALVGVGQSMYRIEEYTSVNSVGTAVLLETLSKKPVERLVVASSMSIYGEGLYHDARGRVTASASRGLEQLRAGNWELCSDDGSVLSPVATPETKAPNLESVYALSKYDQERMSLVVGRAYGIPTVALRFFNAYGPRQALSNPYTGVLAIFASRLLNGNRPLVFEDGLQRRDFVSVHDVVRACALAMESKQAPGNVYNVGSGRSVTVLEVAERVAAGVGRPELAAELTGRYRVGDIRHCFANIDKARRELGYEPHVTLEEGIHELSQWLSGQVARDRVASARAELEMRGLTL